ncbi:molybdopterin-synthase adenylyltransferase MoeB [Microbulbifer variabilis]|uniref:Molybdopterin-synthase adenylyltransferase MoeB n=1 Tax=Microbulbifer variabilis TaxID=266805 RepID=A0ABY4VDQ1_9GAMM|nr:molybdopterin-synthase adenylyltransferase MoeB [Microbulbifer variabilis]USD22421.1 molybdopterin-synthase adenylyltransferase MoeB [Microbulbifer variabilis]
MTLPPLVSPVHELSKQEMERYSRHLLLPDIGIDGQKRLKNSKVLIIGAGGLGSPALLYLAAAGVGTLGIVDFDTVDASNLQRQVIHGQSNIGENKLDSAKATVQEVNPFVHVELHETRLDRTNALEIISDYDLILDGTDNFATRYLVNDACVMAKKPYVWGSIFRFEGQASVFWENAPGDIGINYRDLYPEPPPPEHAPSCSEGGVLGVLCAAIGSIMATEAIKLLTGIGSPLIGKLMVYDALDMTFRKLPIYRNPDRKPITELCDYEFFCGLTKPSQAQEEIPTLTSTELHKIRQTGKSHLLIDVRESGERDICCIEGAIHIPKADILAGRGLESIDKNTFIVLHCKVGGRSRQALAALENQGFTNLYNLHGGILAWIKDIEPELPAY